jgi:polyribonucleotide nucleotidyltransferase
MSLMDAGVPIKKPAAGIAMGLMMEPDASAFKVLTDLQGPEDFYGDMDFKVAGTREGINAIQLDVKINGLTMPIVRQTLSQARDARLEILDFINTIIPASRSELSKFVPAIASLMISPTKIGTLIGPGGKMINGLVEKYGLNAIDVEDDGSVFVSGTDRAKVDQAASEIKALTKEYRPGEIVEGRIFKTLDFGALMDLGGGRDGLIHVSELKDGYVEHVEDVVKVGDTVRAKIIRVDEDGRIGLSMKQSG